MFEIFCHNHKKLFLSLIKKFKINKAVRVFKSNHILNI